MSRLLLLGDSHAAVYARAVNEIKGAGNDLLLGGPLGAASALYKDFFEISNSRFSFKSDRLAENYNCWKVACKADGLEYSKGRLVLSMGLSPTNFTNNRFWARAAPQARTRKRFVSSGAVEYFVSCLQEHVIKFYNECVSQGLLVAVLMPPPPQRAQLAFRFLTEDDFFSLSEAYQAPLKQFLAKNAIPILDLNLADADGFLLEKYRGDDVNHASTACGPELVSRLERFLQERQ